MKKIDIGVGIGLIIFSVAVFFKANSYRLGAVSVYGPNFFPQILSALTCMCAICLLINAVRGNAIEAEDHIDKRGFLRMICAIGICVGYLFLMQVIGFALATCVFIFSLMALLSQVGMLKRIINSIVVSLVIWGIFRFFLLIPIPTGIFSFTF